MTATEEDALVAAGEPTKKELATQPDPKYDPSLDHESLDAPLVSAGAEIETVDELIDVVASRSSERERPADPPTNECETDSATVPASDSDVFAANDITEDKMIEKSGGTGSGDVDSGENMQEYIAAQSALASQLNEDDKLLEAARVLKKLESTKLTRKQRALLSKADEVDDIVASLESPPDCEHGWTKLGESHVGTRDTLIYYKLEHPKDAYPTLRMRLQTPIDQNLLVPLISVLNESELYDSWLPKWSMPKFGIRRVLKLRQMGRCSQVLLVTFDSPWPFAPREVVLRALAVDDIDTHGDIAIQMKSLETGDEDGLVPPVDDSKIKRIDFSGGFLIRRSPPDSCDTNAKKEDEEILKSSEKILLSFCMSMNDRHINVIPQWLLNFVVRTVFSCTWNMLLNVAEDVRDGKRPLHREAIHRKRLTLYDWVDSRVKQMLSTP